MGLATTTENNTGGEVAQMKTGKTLWNASHPMTGTRHAYTQTLSREASSAVRNNSFFVLFCFFFLMESSLGTSTCKQHKAYLFLTFGYEIYSS